VGRRVFRRGETPLIAGRCCSCSVFVAGSRIRPTCVCVCVCVVCVLRAVGVFDAGS
jgi:hypothetical protein